MTTLESIQLPPTVPRLMAFQDQPFNGDHHLAEAILRLKDKHNCRVAIETGTALGVTTRWLAQNFDDVRTVDIAPVDNATAVTLAGLANVTQWFGDSAFRMPEMLRFINRTPLLFLDAHPISGVIPKPGDCPLPRELDAIADARIRPVLVMHDFLVPDKHFGYDSHTEGPFCYSWIKDELARIYGDRYDHYYNREAAGACRGVLFVEPT